MTVSRMRLRFTRSMEITGPIFGVSPKSSWVEVDDDLVRVKMGVLARADIPRSHIKDARPMEWSWWAGLGVRWYGPRRWGLIGSTQGVVELMLDPPTRMRMVLPVRAKRLAISVEDPDRLLDLLGFGDRVGTPPV
jgi:hypothetical protein